MNTQRPTKCYFLAVNLDNFAGDHYNQNMIRVVILLLLFPVFGFGEGGDFYHRLGRPFIRNFTPQEFNGHPQSWSFVQDRRGVIYVGNTAGLLEYDGARWRLIGVPNSKLVRALAAGPDGTVYIGTLSDFGYLATDRTQGNLRFVSLKDRIVDLKKSFVEIWRIYVTTHGVYFLTYSDICFRYDGNSVYMHDLKSTSNFAVNINDRIFTVGGRGEGLREIRSGKIIPLPQTEPISDRSGRVFIVSYGDNKLLALSDRGGSFIYHLDQLTPDNKPRSSSPLIEEFPTELDDYKDHINIFGMVKVQDKYALASQQYGVVVIDSQGKIIQVINRNTGLLSSNILGIAVDRDHNIWAAQDKGISYIEISSPITKFPEESGIEGIPHAYANFDGMLYIGSMRSLYYCKETSMRLDRPTRIFEPVKKNRSYCYELLKLGDSLLSAGEKGIFRIQKGEVIETLQIASHVFCFGSTPKFPNTLFAGKYPGLLAVEILWQDKASGKFKFGKVTSFPEIRTSVRMIVADPEGDLWMNAEVAGVYHVKFNGKSLDSYQATLYNHEQGLTKGSYLWPAHVNNQLYVTSGIVGFFKREKTGGDPEYRFVPDMELGKPLNEIKTGVAQVSKDPLRDRFFLYSSLGIGSLYKENGAYVWDRTPFRKLPRSTFRFFPDKNIIWICSHDALYTFDTNIKKDTGRPFQPLIRKVTWGRQKEVFSGTFYDTTDASSPSFTHFSATQPKEMEPMFDYEKGTIKFEFAAPFYEGHSALVYSTKLEGFDKDWTSWNKDTRREFTNLPAGSYSFKAGARNVFGVLSSEAAYRFKILPPWEQTTWAYFGYIICMFFLMWGLTKFNTRRLARAKVKLEKVVKERTREVVKQRDQISEQKGEIETAYQELYTTNRQLVETRNALWGEMELAKKIQTVLLPEEPLIPGYEICGYMHPADEVGGDYYDVIEVDGKHWIVIGDVSGHGVPAGLVMMMAQTSLHSLLKAHPEAPPTKILSMVNHVIHSNIQKLGEDKYMTITVFSCIADGKMYFSGLHQDIMIYRAATKDVELVETQGMWIGLLDNIGDMLEINSLQLSPGDVMFLYTDGIPESTDKEGNMYSDEKLVETFKHLAHLPPIEIRDGILNSLTDQFTSDDDITLLILKKTSSSDINLNRDE